MFSKKSGFELFQPQKFGIAFRDIKPKQTQGRNMIKNDSKMNFKNEIAQMRNKLLQSKASKQPQASSHKHASQEATQ